MRFLIIMFGIFLITGSVFSYSVEMFDKAQIIAKKIDAMLQDFPDDKKRIILQNVANYAEKNKKDKDTYALIEDIFLILRKTNDLVFQDMYLTYDNYISVPLSKFSKKSVCKSWGDGPDNIQEYIMIDDKNNYNSVKLDSEEYEPLWSGAKEHILLSDLLFFSHVGGCYSLDLQSGNKKFINIYNGFSPLYVPTPILNDFLDAASKLDFSKMVDIMTYLDGYYIYLFEQDRGENPIVFRNKIYKNGIISFRKQQMDSVGNYFVLAYQKVYKDNIITIYQEVGDYAFLSDFLYQFLDDGIIKKDVVKKLSGSQEQFEKDFGKCWNDLIVYRNIFDRNCGEFIFRLSELQSSTSVNKTLKKFKKEIDKLQFKKVEKETEKE